MNWLLPAAQLIVSAYGVHRGATGLRDALGGKSHSDEVLVEASRELNPGPRKLAERLADQHIATALAALPDGDRKRAARLIAPMRASLVAQYEGVIEAVAKRRAKSKTPRGEGAIPPGVVKYGFRDGRKQPLKRPPADAIQRLITYRTETALAANTAKSEGVPPDDPAYRYLAREYEWAKKTLLDAGQPIPESKRLPVHVLLTTADGREVWGYYGAQTEVIVPQQAGMQKIPARYALAPIDAVTPSHDPQTYAPSPSYPPELQERDYANDRGEQLKVERGANRLEPGLVLNSNPDAINGPPVVGAHLRVLGGNSRAMMISRAYAKGKDKYDAALRDELDAHCAKFGLEGLTATQTRGMMLVRVISGTYDPVTISADLNRSLTQTAGRASQAVSLAARLPAEMYDVVASAVSEGASLREAIRDSEQELIAELRRADVINARNQADYLEERRGRARLTARGELLLVDGMLGGLVADKEVLARAERATLNWIERVSAPILAIHAIDPENRHGYDLLAPMRAAIHAYMPIQGATSAEFDAYWANTSLVDERDPAVVDDQNPIGAILLRYLHENRRRYAASARAFAEYLRGIPPEVTGKSGMLISRSKDELAAQGLDPDGLLERIGMPPRSVVRTLGARSYLAGATTEDVPPSEATLRFDNPRKKGPLYPADIADALAESRVEQAVASLPPAVRERARKLAQPIAGRLAEDSYDRAVHTVLKRRAFRALQAAVGESGKMMALREGALSNLVLLREKPADGVGPIFVTLVKVRSVYKDATRLQLHAIEIAKGPNNVWGFYISVSRDRREAAVEPIQTGIRATVQDWRNATRILRSLATAQRTSAPDVKRREAMRAWKRGARFARDVLGLKQPVKRPDTVARVPIGDFTDEDAKTLWEAFGESRTIDELYKQLTPKLRGNIFDAPTRSGRYAGQPLKVALAEAESRLDRAKAEPDHPDKEVEVKQRTDELLEVESDVWELVSENMRKPADQPAKRAQLGADEALVVTGHCNVIPFVRATAALRALEGVDAGSKRRRAELQNVRDALKTYTRKCYLEWVATGMPVKAWEKIGQTLGAEVRKAAQGDTPGYEAAVAVLTTTKGDALRPFAQLVPLLQKGRVERLRTQLEKDHIAALIKKSNRHARNAKRIDNPRGAKQARRESRGSDAPARAAASSPVGRERNPLDSAQVKILADFRKYVNMSAPELSKWSADKRHKCAGTPEGHRALRELRAMTATTPEHWSKGQWARAKKAVDFVKRHLAGKPLFGAEVGQTGYSARAISLKNWGHDPARPDSPAHRHDATWLAEHPGAKERR